MDDNHKPGDCSGDSTCDMCREYRHYRRADAAKRAKIIAQTMKDTEATTKLTATVIPEPDDDEWYQCKCGEELEEADVLTICPACRRIGCWVYKGEIVS